MAGPPTIIEQPASTVYPASDHAPAASASKPIDWPVEPWRDHIRGFLDRNAPGQLSLFADDGFALPFTARNIRLDGDKLVMEMPNGLPWTQTSGTAGFTFEGRATFVGQMSRDGSTYRFAIERMLPHMPMVIRGEQVLVPEGKEDLLGRLRTELGRRGQEIPDIPPVKPEATPGSYRRRERLDAIMKRSAPQP